MPKVVLKSITCHKPSETDKDEIYINYRGNKIWPDSKFVRIDTDETIELNVPINNPTIWVEIELWDYDYLSRNDHLGDFVFKSSNYSREYQVEMKVMDRYEGKVEYTLTYEIVN